MLAERPRARRYPFKAKIELTDLQSETQIAEQTGNLSLYGCQVQTAKTLPVGTAVWLRILHQGGSFEAHGRVANIRPQTGIGILFTNVEGKHQIVLEKWIAELRDTTKSHSPLSHK
jgi:hypothetical protein